MSMRERCLVGIGGEWKAGGDGDGSGSVSGSGVGHVVAEKRKEMDVPNAEEVVRNADMRQPKRRERGEGGLAGGEEEKLRIKICDVLSDELKRLGRGVEEKEGKDGREWRNAVGMDEV
jgi:hypothetical protein